MGNPNRVPDPERHIETYEGRPVDPRFASREDPYKDPRFDTHLNPAAVVPRRPGATLLVLAITLGVVILALITLWLLRGWGWGKPSPRSPENPHVQIMKDPVRPHPVGAVLPLAHYRDEQSAKTVTVGTSDSRYRANVHVLRVMPASEAIHTQ